MALVGMLACTGKMAYSGMRDDEVEIGVASEALMNGQSVEKRKEKGDAQRWLVCFVSSPLPNAVRVA